MRFARDLSRFAPWHADPNAFNVFKAAVIPSAHCDLAWARSLDPGVAPADGAANGPSGEATLPGASSTGYKLANDDHDTRSLAHYLGHRNLQWTARYTALAEGRFAKLWQD